MKNFKRFLVSILVFGMLVGCNGIADNKIISGKGSEPHVIEAFCGRVWKANVTYDVDQQLCIFLNQKTDEFYRVIIENGTIKETILLSWNTCCSNADFKISNDTASVSGMKNGNDHELTLELVNTPTPEDIIKQYNETHQSK